MSNIFAKLLVDRAAERFSIDATGMPVSEWICKNTTLRKAPFSFKGYEFQKKIADDMHPDLNVIKISQVGLTEIQIRKALSFLCRNRGTSLIFSLPNEDMYERISKARIKPIINADRVFNTTDDIINKAVRSAELMQFGQSFLYIVAAIESAATSISADFVMNDEIDLSNQQSLSLFNSRLQGSKYKISQKFSTPSYPFYGIDLNWQTSDQFHYMCRCDSCGHWNHPEFNHDFIHLPGIPSVKELTDISIEYQDNIDFDNSFIKCEKCGGKLDLNNPANREWVSKYPSRSSRGYRITPFVNGNLDIKYILKSLWQYQKMENVRGFHNTVLGLAYSDGNIQIPIQDIEACITDETLPADLSKFNDIWIGVDVGQICHIVIGVGPDKEHVDIVSMYPIKIDLLTAHLEELCKKDNVRGGCIDRHPYEPTAREIMKVTNGKIIPVEYRGTKDANIILDEHKEVSHAQVNHTMFLDSIATKIRKHKIKISGYGYQKQTVKEHFRDMVREEIPGEPAKWNKLHGNDHYFHASGFMVSAPFIHEVIRFTSKADQRIMSVVMMKTYDDKTPDLIGLSNKRLDRNPFNV